MAKELMEIGGFITSGAEIVNHDNTLSGKGTVDSPLGLANETVLWSGNAATACTLSESPSAFDRIRFYGYRNEGSISNSKGVFEFPTEGMTGYDLNQLKYNDDCTYRAIYLSRYSITGTSCSLTKAQHLFATTASTTWSGPGTVPILVYKIVGINRKV